MVFIDLQSIIKILKDFVDLVFNAFYSNGNFYYINPYVSLVFNLLHFINFFITLKISKKT
jgi:hypothetical protein